MDGPTLLQALIDSRKLNPTSLAARLGNKNSQSQFHRFLSRKTKNPKREALQPAADFFEVPVDAFFNDEMADAEAARLGLTPDSAPTPSHGRNVRPLRRAHSKAELVAALHTLAKNLELVGEDARDALSKKFASLVLAPDSASLINTIADQLASAQGSQLGGGPSLTEEPSQGTGR